MTLQFEYNELRTKPILLRATDDIGVTQWEREYATVKAAVREALNEN